MLLRKISLLIVLIAGFANSDVCAQQGAFVITAPDSLAFLLEVDEVKVNPEWANQMHSGPLAASGHAIVVEFQNSTYATFSTSILVAEGKETTYRLRAKKNPQGEYSMALRMVGEAKFNLAVPESTPEVVVVNQTLPLDTALVDSMLPIPRAGCGVPPTEVEFNVFFQEYESMSFQFQKIQAAEDLINNYCLTVEQVDALLLSLDFDDQRYELAAQAAPRVYNPEQLNALTSSFQLEMVQAQWKQLLKDMR